MSSNDFSLLNSLMPSIGTNESFLQETFGSPPAFNNPSSFIGGESLLGTSLLGSNLIGPDMSSMSQFSSMMPFSTGMNQSLFSPGMFGSPSAFDSGDIGSCHGHGGNLSLFSGGGGLPGESMQNPNMIGPGVSFMPQSNGGTGSGMGLPSSKGGSNDIMSIVNDLMSRVMTYIRSVIAKLQGSQSSSGGGDEFGGGDGFGGGGGGGGGGGNGYGNYGNYGGGGDGGDGGGGGNGYGNYGGGGGGGVTDPGDTGDNTGVTPAKGLPAYSGKPIEVQQTIVVKAGETFDGHNQYYKAGSALGDGGQSEHQKPVFILEDGATLKNVQLSGADGIHVNGNGKLINVWNRDVGEDAVTQKKPGNLEVIGGGAFNADDKIFQLNANGSLHISGFLADGFGKGVRTNGGHNITTDIVITNSTFRNGKEAIVRTDSSPGTTITLQNVTSSNVPWEVLAPDYNKVTGATRRSYKPYSG